MKRKISEFKDFSKKTKFFDKFIRSRFNNIERYKKRNRSQGKLKGKSIFTPISATFYTYVSDISHVLLQYLTLISVASFAYFRDIFTFLN